MVLVQRRALVRECGKWLARPAPFTCRSFSLSLITNFVNSSEPFWMHHVDKISECLFEVRMSDFISV